MRPHPALTTGSAERRHAERVPLIVIGRQDLNLRLAVVTRWPPHGPLSALRRPRGGSPGGGLCWHRGGIVGYPGDALAAADPIRTCAPWEPRAARDRGPNSHSERGSVLASHPSLR